jgi:hypothetical protein
LIFSPICLENRPSPYPPPGLETVSQSRREGMNEEASAGEEVGAIHESPLQPERFRRGTADSKGCENLGFPARRDP